MTPHVFRRMLLVPPVPVEEGKHGPAIRPVLHGRSGLLAKGPTAACPPAPRADPGRPGGAPGQPLAVHRPRSCRSPAPPSPERHSGLVPVGWWGARLPCTRRPCGPTPTTRASGGDTKLPKATLYSGSQIPGGGPYAHTAPIPPSAAASRVAVFNAGFLMSNASGGYFTDGETILPLRQGRAPSSSTTTAPRQTGSGASTAPRRPPSCP